MIRGVLLALVAAILAIFWKCDGFNSSDSAPAVRAIEDEPRKFLGKITQSGQQKVSSALMRRFSGVLVSLYCVVGGK